MKLITLRDCLTWNHFHTFRFRFHPQSNTGTLVQGGYLRGDARKWGMEWREWDRGGGKERKSYVDELMITESNWGLISLVDPQRNWVWCSSEWRPPYWLLNPMIEGIVCGDTDSSTPLAALLPVDWGSNQGLEKPQGRKAESPAVVESRAGRGMWVGPQGTCKPMLPNKPALVQLV